MFGLRGILGVFNGGCYIIRKWRKLWWVGCIVWVGKRGMWADPLILSAATWSNRRNIVSGILRKFEVGWQAEVT